VIYINSLTTIKLYLSFLSVKNGAAAKHAAIHESFTASRVCSCLDELFAGELTRERSVVRSRRLASIATQRHVRSTERLREKYARTDAALRTFGEGGARQGGAFPARAPVIILEIAFVASRARTRQAHLARAHAPLYAAHRHTDTDEDRE
jgi:hypothetical protein